MNPNTVLSTLLVHTDGGARGNPGPAATGIIVQDENLKIIHQDGSFLNTTTNNVAEYMALLAAVEWIVRFCSTTQVDKVIFMLDSQLVVQQILGNWKIKETHLLNYWQKIRELLTTLPCHYEIRHVPREKNALADRMVNQILDLHLRK